LGVDSNDAESLKWYRMAVKNHRGLADQGNADAQEKLGDMYYFGLGVEKDRSEAIKWYHTAAEKGNIYARAKAGGTFDHKERVGSATKRFSKRSIQGAESKPPELSAEAASLLNQAAEARKRGVLLAELAKLNRAVDMEGRSLGSFSQYLVLADQREPVIKKAVYLGYVHDPNEAKKVTIGDADGCFLLAIHLIEKARKLAPTHPRPVWEGALTACERGPSPGNIVMRSDNFIDSRLLGKELQYNPSILKDCDQALQLDPNDPETFHAYSKVLMKHYEITLQNAKITADLPSGMKTAPDVDMKHRAMNFIDNAILLAPDHGEFYLTRAKFRIDSNEVSDAITDLDLAIRHGSATGEAYCIRGSLRMQQKDYSNACKDLDKAKDLGYPVSFDLYDEAFTKKTEEFLKRRKEELKQQE